METAKELSIGTVLRQRCADPRSLSVPPHTSTHTTTTVPTRGPHATDATHSRREGKTHHSTDRDDLHREPQAAEPTRHGEGSSESAPHSEHVAWQRRGRHEREGNKKAIATWLRAQLGGWHLQPLKGARTSVGEGWCVCVCASCRPLHRGEAQRRHSSLRPRDGADSTPTPHRVQERKQRPTQCVRGKGAEQTIKKRSEERGRGRRRAGAEALAVVTHGREGG